MRSAPGCRPAVLCYAVFVAMSAVAGAFGLVTGRLVTDPTIDHRLPFRSPVFAAIALLVVVGVPAVVVAWLSWHGRVHVRTAAFVAGALIAGWIPIELGFTRDLSWREVIYACMGAIFIAIGQDASVEHENARAAAAAKQHLAHPNG